MDHNCTIDFDNKTLTCDLYSEFYERAKGSPSQTRTAALPEEALEEARQAAQKLKALHPQDAVAQNSSTFWKNGVFETDYHPWRGSMIPYPRYRMMYCIEIGPSRPQSDPQDICELVSESSDKQLQSAVLRMKSEIGLESLNNPNESVKLEAARWASHIDEEAALRTVIPLLQNDPNQYFRGEAASVLGLFQNVRSENALLSAALNDASPHVRQNALISLDRIGTKKSIALLSQALQRGAENFSGACTRDWLPKPERISEECVGKLRDETKNAIRRIHERLTAKPLAVK